MLSSIRAQIDQKSYLLFSEAVSQSYYKHKLNLPKNPYLLTNLGAPETPFYNNLKRTTIVQCNLGYDVYRCLHLLLPRKAEVVWGRQRRE